VQDSLNAVLESNSVAHAFSPKDTGCLDDCRAETVKRLVLILRMLQSQSFDPLSELFPFRQIVVTLGPPRHARILSNRGLGRVPYFLFCQITFQAADRPHNPTPHASPKINQSISRTSSARRVQLQKGNAPRRLHSSSINHFSPTPTHSIPSVAHLRHKSHFLQIASRLFTPAKMPPKSADKKPASKAPATASKAPEKKDAGKKTAASGDKKKRTKARKETYSSYIYKGKSPCAF
jgi:hypothetical protein